MSDTSNPDSVTRNACAVVNVENENSYGTGLRSEFVVIARPPSTQRDR